MRRHGQGIRGSLLHITQVHSQDHHKAAVRLGALLSVRACRKIMLEIKRVGNQVWALKNERRVNPSLSVAHMYIIINSSLSIIFKPRSTQSASRPCSVSASLTPWSSTRARCRAADCHDMRALCAAPPGAGRNPVASLALEQSQAVPAAPGQRSVQPPALFSAPELQIRSTVPSRSSNSRGRLHRLC